MSIDERPLVSPPIEESLARSMFDTGMTPERWLARFGHTLVLGYGFEQGYDDPELDEWMHRLGVLVDRSRNYPNLDHFRRKHLTWRERQQVRKEIRELEEPGI